MKSTSTTEQEMRAETAPTPKDAAELSEYIESLTERKHDYGTCVYAMSLAATAAFNMVASKLGVTGFQASCADMDILTRTRSIEGPWMILQARDALFPQSNPMAKARESMEKWQDWLAGEAKKKIATGERVHPDVLEHWADLAFPDYGDEWAKVADKVQFLRNKFTLEFIETHIADFQRHGLLDVHLFGEESVATAEVCEEGACVRLDMPVSLWFRRNIDGIKVSWGIDTELPGSNGKSILRIDFDKLSKLEAEATNPSVKAALQAYMVKARG